MGIRNWIVLGASVISWGIVATPAAAEIKRIDYTVRSEPNQSFSTLIQQAESLATSFIEQGFAEDTSVTEISVNILGERNGQQVPLLASRVARSNWQNQPQIRPWTRYFRASAVLLGFRKPAEPNYTPAIAPIPVEESNSATSTPTQSPAGTTFIQQPTATPNTTDSPIQAIPTPNSGTTVQPPTPTPIPTTGNTTDTTQPLTSPDTTLEESDPGFR